MPYFSPISFVPINIPADPSTMPDELPAVWTWLTASTSGYLCCIVASKPAISPIIANDGSSEPSDCIVASGLICSSWSRIVSPFISVTGTTEFLKRLSSQAAFALF